MRLSQNRGKVQTVFNIADLDAYTINSDLLDVANRIRETDSTPIIPYQGDVVAIGNNAYNALANRNKIISHIKSLTTSVTIPKKILLVDDNDIGLKFDSVYAQGQLSQEEGGTNASLVKFEQLLAHAIKCGTNDIHIKLDESLDTAVAMMKIEGEYDYNQNFNFVNFEQAWSMLRALYDSTEGKQTGGDLNKVHMQETDLSFKLTQSIDNSDFRQSSLIRLRFNKTVQDRMKGKIYVVLRVLHEGAIGDIETKGYNSELLQTLKRNLSKASGMVVTCGPTSSGKTTLLFGSLKYWPTRKTMQTLEDPIEYQLNRPNIIQNQMANGDAVETAMRAMLRQDPDGVLVGEIRDKESMEMAIKIAQSSHLCMTTVHANNVLGIIDRFLGMGVAPKDLAAPGTLALLMSQRLVRLVCPDCSHGVDALTNEIDKQDVQTKLDLMKLSSLQENVRIANPNGCPKCNQKGFVGRTAVVEHREVTKEDRLYISKLDWTGWEEHLASTGFVSINTRITDLARRGQVCLNAAYNYLTN